MEEETAKSEIYDLRSILSSDDGSDFLIRRNGDQVNISNILDRKIVGLYFSASWCGPCMRFTPKLVEAYDELAIEGDGFEVVFVSADQDDDSFHKYFSKMPWLSIPFSHSGTRERLDELFKVEGIPRLVVLDASGKIITNDAVQILTDYGPEAYPFTPERIKLIKEAKGDAKKRQTLGSVLSSSSRDYLISNNGCKVPVSELEGKIVGLYFFNSTLSPCLEFTPRLEEMYGKLKEKGESFEVVLVSLDNEESCFEASFASMPWLAIPFKDKARQNLVRYFEIRSFPTLIVLGSNGKTLQPNVVDLVELHGVEAFPFSPEKLEELESRQTLESLLVFGERDYVIGEDDTKVPVSELVGKNILLYFSAQWCGPCTRFLPKLIEEYHKMKNKDSSFEIVFISWDRDESSFEDFFSGMPWLALPFGDERAVALKRRFKIAGIPTLVAISPTGRTVTKEAKKHLVIHGSDAYPFTEERIKQLEFQLDEMAKGWPEKLKHELHEEHELTLMRGRNYVCDRCDASGVGWWSYTCTECDFDLHPNCALKDNKVEEAAASKEGYVCDGEVCYKA